VISRPFGETGTGITHRGHERQGPGPPFSD